MRDTLHLCHDWDKTSSTILFLTILMLQPANICQDFHMQYSKFSPTKQYRFMESYFQARINQNYEAFDPEKINQQILL